MRGSGVLVLAALALGTLASGVAAAADELAPASLPDDVVGSMPPLPARIDGPFDPSTPPIPAPSDSPFAANVRVSEADTPGNQNEVTMAVASDGRIHMGWNDRRAPEPDYRCGYSYSTDSGQTWSANRFLHVAGWTASGDPVVIVDSDDTVYFICMPFSRSGGGSRIVVYRSTDGGVTFDPPVTVSDTTSGFNDKPWAHAVGTTLHVCYANFVGGSELRYTRSTDGGQTWAPTRVLDNNGNGCVFASAASGMLYLGWVRGGGIYVLSSFDGGTTWSAPRFAGAAPFTSAGDQRAGPLPAIAADWNGGNVYVVWSADDGMGTWDVRFSRSTDNGVTWSAPVSPSDVLTGRQFMPGIGVDASGMVHVSWYDTRTGLVAYRYAASANGGQTWIPSFRVTDTEWATQYFIGDYTTLVADSLGNVNCAWADARSGEVEAYFARAPGPNPPILTRIDVAPPEAWTDADTPVMFSAIGYDQYGGLYPTNPAWQATGGTIVGGGYTPQLAGDWRVWANESGISGSAVVHVSPGALTRIEIAPPTATLTADETLQFTATGYDAQDNLVSISPTWAATNGSIAGGWFSPYRVGAWAVYANESGVSDSATVTVLPGALAAIDVTPPVATITADDVVDFDASGRDAKGNAVAVAPVWSAAGGTIDLQGVYAAQMVGLWAVQAEDAGVQGLAQVTVTPGALARIDVTPPNVVITADDVVSYTAQGFDADGNAVGIVPLWSTDGGSVSPAALYTPGPVGMYRVVASVGIISGEATVTVFPGALARIEIEPPTATITADDTIDLVATGYDAKGNLVGATFAWDATCGAVTPAGRFEPALVGVCFVYANASGISGAAAITVTPGLLARLEVTPPTLTVTADETAQFSVRGFDAKGNEVPAAPVWRADEGSVDGSGLYSPWRAGAWGVHAEVGLVVGSAQVTVVPGALARLLVTPETVSIRTDETATFSVTGFDRAGNEVLLGPVAWSATNGTIEGGRFEPWTAGRQQVRATVGTKQGVATATVRPGPIASVVLSPVIASVREGDSGIFTARAYDSKGNAVDDAQLAWRVDGAIGRVDAGGKFTATAGGTGRVVVVATGGGGAASAFASVEVPSSPVYLWLVVAVLLLLPPIVLWRRRRRDGERAS